MSKLTFRMAAACAIAAWAVLAAGCGGHSSAIPQPSGPVLGPEEPAPPVMPQSVGAPTHVANFTFWQQSGIATQVPASWMAQWATYVETGASTYATQFHSAGGKYAVAYTDPNYFYTSSSWTSPGNYAESAFGHHSGSRIWRTQGSGTEKYLLSNSSNVKTVFAGVVSNIKAGGGYNYAYADGVSANLSTSLYRFNFSPAEMTTNTEYINGMKTVLGGVSLPVIANGYNNGDALTEAQEYTGATNIVGLFGETCFAWGTGVYTGTQWTTMADALLYSTTHHSLAVCGGRGTESDNRALRTYWTASWWLTYDSTYSVALENFSSSGGVAVFAEETLVPVSPLQTASSTISQLQKSNGTYAREFAGCYNKGGWWDSCAAVVNASSSTLSVPTLSKTYHHVLVLDNNNLYNGGKVSLSSSVPKTLAPGTAVLLFG